MRVFWWIKEHKIAGMARPGFNGTTWFDFPHDEPVLVGWIAQFSSGSTSLPDLHHHVKIYGSKIRSFYILVEQTADNQLRQLFDKNGIVDISKKIIERSDNGRDSVPESFIKNLALCMRSAAQFLCKVV